MHEVRQEAITITLWRKNTKNGETRSQMVPAGYKFLPLERRPGIFGTRYSADHGDNKPGVAGANRPHEFSLVNVRCRNIL